ncbi:MAG: sulfite exporter TauE/SafE family protein [Bacteroidota bacterium]|nr:sulfite exporter TauE/SafE family protein [Bacteroidota bacterium]
MSIQVILILVVIGLLAGIMGGLVGIGGGIVIVPALIYFLSFSQKEAQGTSLGILLLPIGILGVWQYYKAGYVDMRIVWLVAGGFLIGSYFGSKIALVLPQEAVKKIFAVLMIIVAFKMLFLDKKMKDENDSKVTEISIPPNENSRSIS